MSDHHDDGEPEVASDVDVQAEDQPSDHKDEDSADDGTVPPTQSVDAAQHPDIS